MFPNYTPQIETFPRRVGSSETIIGVDLQLEDEVPIDALPWVTALRVSAPADNDEAKAAGHFPAESGYDIEKQLFSPLTGSATKSAVLVGSVSSLQSAEWFIYSREPLAEQLEEAISERFPDIEVHARAQHDPGWSVYREFLCPSQVERFLLRNRRTVRELAELGQSTDDARPVDHTVWFTSPDDRNAFAETVADDGFALHYPDQDVPLEADEEDVEYGLTITRAESVTIEQMDELVRELFKLTSRFGGEYEGWHVQH
ncbi:DUF695 domain-containing protein [Persicimonas caeni]|uniref:DUF695 domain-containing protein n=1 Tax=Persicimonas caeni TaxID=2292766 RepID=A0A4Y6PTC7_PERCE|nr:DUF695 domain-containing protein [Persicimonas caeni]QDG51277.1 DUF695 domain-containing protein [Persicimonas caeni]QED32498.1 DUF695 domain-containing protein [Persicimonas caeni]